MKQICKFFQKLFVGKSKLEIYKEELDKYAAYKKCDKTIRSCKTTKHWQTANNLVCNFYMLFQDAVLFNRLCTDLDSQYDYITHGNKEVFK